MAIMKRIAVFLDNINCRELTKDMRQVFLFEVDEKVVTAIGEEIMMAIDVNYMAIWLLSKSVNTIYIDGVNYEAYQLLERLDIGVRPLTEIRQHPMLSALLMDSK